MTHWQDELGKRLIYLDGGMGTLLQGMGLQGGERPESWNLSHPDRVKSVHAAYLQAGCDILTANTFGATETHFGGEWEAVLRAGVRLAREAVAEAGRGWVALDAGSLGRLLAPVGDLPFEEAVRIYGDFARVGEEAGCDLFLLETQTDLREVKAAVLGAKERSALPIAVSMAFDAQTGRLLTGASIEAAVAMLADLGVAAVGLNCADSPDKLSGNIDRVLACCPLPVTISPNASLPTVTDGQTVYGTTPERFAADMRAVAEKGAWMLGGCCGTTPEHIRQMIEATRGLAPVARDLPRRCVLSGAQDAFDASGAPFIIGERINPTGKKRLKQALREGDMDYLLGEATAQQEAGAAVLDVNVGLPELDEPRVMREAVEAIQGVCGLPLQLDSADAAALEAGLRVCIGKPLVNSVSGKRAVLDAVLPLCQKYGAALVCLTLDESGIPETAEGRVAIARRILAEAEKYGIAKERLFFDALTMAVSTDPQAAQTTLETVRRLRGELGVQTVLGVSNVSFGLPQRGLLTASFASMAVQSGLNAAILNPLDDTVRVAFDAAATLCGYDAGFAGYIRRYGADAAKYGVAKQAPALGTGVPLPAAPGGAGAPPPSPYDGAIEAIRRGMSKAAAQAVDQLLDGGAEPLAVVDAAVMPALSAVGDGFEKGTLFLPQLLQAAQAAQAAFDALRARMPAQSAAGPEKRIVLATVQGDVHDIGKNIVKVLLQNYGYTVLDLGKDVAPEAVARAVTESGAPLCGLSALMTTTVPAMERTIALLRRECPGVKVMVGGAVLTAEYAGQIGADYYGKDAMASVRYAGRVFDGKVRG